MSEHETPQEVQDTPQNADSGVEVIVTGELAETLRNAAVATEDGEPAVIDECFVTEDGKVVSSKEIINRVLAKSMEGINADDIHNEIDNTGLLDVMKALAPGSAQQEAEIGSEGMGLAASKIVEPPFPPKLMAKFLEVDETHFRACHAKARDSVGRKWFLQPVTASDGDDLDPSETSDEDTQKINDEKLAIKNFCEECNEISEFEGVLEQSAMDHEAIGWGAIEVVRSRDMKIRRLLHVPAERLRVVRGFEGFVELTGSGSKKIYYLPFGHKVVGVDPDTDEVEPYNPRKHGELSPSNDRLSWNFVQRDSGEATAATFENSANEIIWIPRIHPNTVYYGYSDVVPALGHLLTNAHIRDYLLQFFEHNTVPQYAIIIEGAKMSPDVQDTIMRYFSSEVKGKHHKTLIVPVPSLGGEVKVRFEKLTSDHREGSFQETRKNGAQGIMVAHGTPPAILGIHEAASLGSGKGLSQAEIYKDRIVTPSQMRWAKKINRLFRLGLGITMVELKFTPLDTRDLELEMKTSKGYLESGCTTINEIRERNQLGDPIEGGNRAFIITGQGPMFVDELELMSAEERMRMENELETLRSEMSARAPSGPQRPKPLAPTSTQRGNNNGNQNNNQT